MRLCCPQCGKTVESPVELAVGQRVQCPYCLSKFAFGDQPVSATSSVRTVVTREIASAVMATVRSEAHEMVSAKASASRRPPTAPKAKSAGKPGSGRPGSGGPGSPTLDQMEEDGGGSKKIVTVVLWVALIGAALLCLPRLKRTVVEEALPAVAPTLAASQGFEPVEFENETVPRSARSRRTARPSYDAADRATPPKPAIFGARLGFCTDPRKLGPGTFAKRFGDIGTLYAVGDRAYFCPAKTNMTWELAGVRAAFDPTARVLGDVRKSVEALELDTKRAAFRVKVGRVDPRREGQSKYSRRVEWAVAADVPYGGKVARATLENAVGELQKIWAREHAKELFPLDAKLMVKIQVYDGRKIYFNQATGKWLLPRYRDQCDDPVAWDRVNGQQEKQQKLFVEHRRKVREQRRQWYENHITGEYLFNAVKMAEVAVEPHDAGETSAPAKPVAAKPSAPAAEDDDLMIEEPVIEPLSERPAPAAPPKPAPSAMPKPAPVPPPKPAPTATPKPAPVAPPKPAPTPEPVADPGQEEFDDDF